MKGRVFKRGNSWYYLVDIGRDSDGKRRQQKRGGFSTKREAQRSLRELLNTVEADRYVEPSQMTVGKFLQDQWLPSMRPPKLRATTWPSYADQIRLHIVPHLGGVQLQKLNPLHLNKLYSDLLAEGRTDDAGGLSARSVRYVHSIVRKALADAVRWGLLERNVADLADPPHQARAHAGEKIRTWTAVQLRTFLKHVQGDHLYACWLVAANTGLRRSELLGLVWDDVDLNAARLSVRRTLVMAGNRPKGAEIPKSKTSRRTVDLDTHTVTALRAWRAKQAEERLACGPDWPDLGLVFTRENGQWIRPDNWSTAFVRHARKADLPPIRPHDLRHTHATLMLQSGIHPKIVSERLGHHSVAFTLDVYSHVVPGMQSEAAQLVADILMGFG